MKPSSVLLLTAAGLATAFPAQPIAARSEIQDTRSFLERAVDVFFARDLVPLNANTAAPPAADAAADKKGAAATTTSAAAAAATTTSAAATTTSAAANNAAAPPAATDSVAAPPPAAATDATTAAPPPPAATDAAAAPPAAGNGTASAGNDGKGKGKGKDQGKGQGQAKGKGKGGNNNNNSLGDAISGALSQLGLDGVLNVGKINSLNGAQQIQLLSQVVALQTLADLSMVTSKQVVVALNQGFKSNGLNVVING
ncbi:hypothetical protein ACHAPV_001823 [Trichoderma viride]